MAQSCERPGLPLEARDPLLVLGEPFGQHLDRHFALELGVARPVHLAHAAGAERRDDLVGAESSAGFELHAVARNSRSRRRHCPECACNPDQMLILHLPDHERRASRAADPGLRDLWGDWQTASSR